MIPSIVGHEERKPPVIVASRNNYVRAINTVDKADKFSTHNYANLYPPVHWLSSPISTTGSAGLWHGMHIHYKGGYCCWWVGWTLDHLLSKPLDH